MASNDQNNVPMYPYMFSPDQFSNKYSPYPDTGIPPTSYVGAPVNAGTGMPISSYAPPQAPAPSAPAPSAPAPSAMGTNINSMPAPSTWPGQAQGAAAPGSLAGSPAMQQLQQYSQAAQAAMTPQQLAIQQQNNAMRNDQMLFNGGGYSGPGGGYGAQNVGLDRANLAYSMGLGQPQQAAPAQAAQPQASGPPNNAGAYISALAHPDPVITQGAQVGTSGGYQPSSAGIDAIMGQIAGMQQQLPQLQPQMGTAGQGVASLPTQFAGSNSGFLNALAALRGVG